MENLYLPEGCRISDLSNREALATPAGIEKAAENGNILEANALLCDREMNLHVDLGCMQGIIPRCEAVFTQNSEDVKDIAVISRVGKPVCFTVERITRSSSGQPVALLSRKNAQRRCVLHRLSQLCTGDIIPVRVTHLERFGAFCDVGCGICALLPLDCISVSRISHPSDRLQPGMMLWCVVRAIDQESGRITLSLRELLGTWEQNAALFGTGQTAAGIIRSVERYGVFVELTPNLAGLAELRPDADANTVARLQACIGRYTGVYIKSIQPDRMKIKLVLIDSYRGEPAHAELRYFIDPERTARLEHWRYSPESAGKVIETVF
jgi:small subunit ribosomal protein S1